MALRSRRALQRGVVGRGWRTLLRWFKGFHLLQAVTQEPQEPEHILMPHEHRKMAQGATTFPLRKSPVYPPDPDGVPEVDFDRLPLDGEESFVPYPPDPAGL